MDENRLKIILYNAFVLLEREYNCGDGETLMTTDLADELGITQEEYDSIMNN